MKIGIAICLSSLLLALCEKSFADTRPAEINFSVGKSAFLDEDIPFDHFNFGGSLRFYLTRHLGIEPEFIFMKGPGTDRDYLLLPNIVYDFYELGNARVYLIGGGGLIHHTERFPFSQDPEFSVTEWTASGGVGTRIHFNDRLFFSADFRVGTEPLMRVSAGIGYRFR